MNGDNVSAKLDTLIDVNRDIRQWLKIMAWDSASEAARGALGERAAEYDLYESLDGETPISKIIENSSIPRRTVYDRLNDWQRVGIVSKVGRGKYRKIAPLDSLGVTPSDED